MLDDQQVNFKNDKEIKDALERWQATSLVEAAKTLQDCVALRNAVKTVEKTKAAELLKGKDNPEKWLELYRAHQTLDQKTDTMGANEPSHSNEQILFDTVLSLIVRQVMHEQLDINPEEDGLDTCAILEKMDPPADIFDEEVEKSEEFQEIMENVEAKDIHKVHSRYAQILTKCNNSYTLKRVDYKVETVKVPTMGFLGKSLFPALGSAFKKFESRTPCGKGRGDWVETPTSFILARTNDLLQEAKGRLSMYAEEKEEEEAKRLRRKRLVLKIKKIFKRS